MVARARFLRDDQESDSAASPLLNVFEQVAGAIRYALPCLPIISAATGRLATADIATPDYWARHLRAGTRLTDAIAALQEQNVDVVLEVGPKPILSNMIKEVAGEFASTALMAPSLRERGADWEQLLSICGELLGRGVPIDWAAFDKDYSRNKLPLPTYPFQRERHWADVSAAQEPQPLGGASKPFDRMIRLPLEEKIICETEFSLERMPYMQDHKILGEVVVPGACFI
jgi:acyl transferase domain-containing protein